MKTTKTETQAQKIKGMDSRERGEFQIRLQIECGLTHGEAANFIAQALGK